ncbi:MAG TPA: hypothetical protein VK736_08340, partial [Candidatus Binatia bacterium]|nr:hypothetical protein [Candidatus Binatia bacterium]
MSTSTIAKTTGRGCLAAVLLVLLVGALGVVYFTLRPPFSLPETGYLGGNTSRDVRLQPESSVAVLELDVRHDPRIFSESPSSHFDPTHLTITTAVAGGADIPIGLRLYPADGKPVTDLSPAADGRSTGWLIDCEAVEARDCARRYLIVASADGLVAEVRVKVVISAKLSFPAHVPTPFLVSIGLDTREVRAGVSGLALHADEAAGSMSVSSDAPVASQALTIPAAGITMLSDDGQPVAGLTLELTLAREGEAIPVGLLAPPPVRAAIVTEDDAEVVIEMGARPGVAVVVALPPLEGGHRLVLIWQDRAAQAYQVNWQLERGTVANTSAPGIEGGAPDSASSVAETTSTGETPVTVGANQPDLRFGVGIDIGEGRPGHLPPVAGVLRLRLELDADGSAPLILLLTPSVYGGAEEVPVILRPGEPVEVALEAIGSCENQRCEPWRGRVRTPGWGSAPGDERVTVHWRAEFELWGLDPVAGSP